jgi:hypothetical protein
MRAMSSEICLYTGQFLKHEAFIICRWSIILDNGWPMLLKYAEANAYNSSGAHNEFPK